MQPESLHSWSKICFIKARFWHKLKIVHIEPLKKKKFQMENLGRVCSEKRINVVHTTWVYYSKSVFTPGKFMVHLIWSEPNTMQNYFFIWCGSRSRCHFCKRTRNSKQKHTCAKDSTCFLLKHKCLCSCGVVSVISAVLTEEPALTNSCFSFEEPFAHHVFCSHEFFISNLEAHK